MPSNKDLRDYVAKLPDIYRDILAAYPAIEPNRKAGYGLAFQTLALHFTNTRKTWSFGDVQAACKQLADGGIIEIKNGIFAHPTDLGEKLIAVLTNTPLASSHSVPVLPPPPGSP